MTSSTFRETRSEDREVRTRRLVSPPAETLIRARLQSGEEKTVPLSEVGARHLLDIRPWRTFRWYRGQRHLPGTYWSARMEGPVGYESRLELANLILMDFASDVQSIVSQPFLLEGWDGKRIRRHVPDYLLRLRDGGIRVIDVKPAHRLDAPKVRDSLGWTRRLMAVPGWEYEIHSEPDPTLSANVRFLSGFRWNDRFEDEEVERSRSVVTAPMSFASAVQRTSHVLKGRARARAVVLHLMWRRLLVSDLTRMLDNDSEVTPA